jgi:hypothetical protein
MTKDILAALVHDQMAERGAPAHDFDASGGAGTGRDASVATTRAGPVSRTPLRRSLQLQRRWWCSLGSGPARLAENAGAPGRLRSAVVGSWTATAQNRPVRADGRMPKLCRLSILRARTSVQRAERVAVPILGLARRRPSPLAALSGAPSACASTARGSRLPTPAPGR